MEAALDEPKPLAEIAEVLGTSPRSLQQQFRLRLNTTPQDHYLQLAWPRPAVWSPTPTCP